jgi:RNA polymerase sigma-70 factor (ECF subfamily)
MDEEKFLAERFGANRKHLRAVAYRMLGSLSEADDAVQEAWLRFSRSDASAVDNVGGWLTTVVARVCLDMLRSRKSRREDPIETAEAAPSAAATQGLDPEQEVLMADAVGLALLVVLEKLAPAERIAFVLHDMFDLSFDEIAPIVGRTPTAARQLASRARRRVQGTDRLPEAELSENRRIVDAFLAASRAGDFEGLLAVLDPNVTVTADAGAMRIGAKAEMRGAELVARSFLGRAGGARTTLVDGAVGAVVAPRGRLFLVLRFTIRDGRIAGIEVMANEDRLDGLDLAVLEG